jgi:hypothetical protein
LLVGTDPSWSTSSGQPRSATWCRCWESGLRIVLATWTLADLEKAVPALAFTEDGPPSVVRRPARLALPGGVRGYLVLDTLLRPFAAYVIRATRAG